MKEALKKWGAREAVEDFRHLDLEQGKVDIRMKTVLSLLVT